MSDIHTLKDGMHKLTDDVAKYSGEVSNIRHERSSSPSITQIIPQPFTNVDSFVEFNKRLGANSLERKQLVFIIIQLAYFLNSFFG